MNYKSCKKQNGIRLLFLSTQRYFLVDSCILFNSVDQFMNVTLQNKKFVGIAIYGTENPVG